jgi:hypothetical protein
MPNLNFEILEAKMGIFFHSKQRRTAHCGALLLGVRVAMICFHPMLIIE